jgi:hypothetical protein
MARAICRPSAASSADQTSPRHPRSSPRRRPRRAPGIGAHRPRGHAPRSRYSRSRFGELVERACPGGHVAGECTTFFTPSARMAAGMVCAQVVRLAARRPASPESEARGELGRHAPVVMKRSCSPSARRRCPARATSARTAGMRRHAAASGVGRSPPARHDASMQNRWPKASLDAQPVLLQAHELREAKRSRRRCPARPGRPGGWRRARASSSSAAATRARGGSMPRAASAACA